MKQVTFFLLALLLTSSYSSLAKEKEQPEQKQLTISDKLLSPRLVISCTNPPECGDGGGFGKSSTTLTDWLKEQITTLKQSKTAPSK